MFLHLECTDEAEPSNHKDLFINWKVAPVSSVAVKRVKTFPVYYTKNEEEKGVLHYRKDCLKVFHLPKSLIFLN